MTRLLVGLLCVWLGLGPACAAITNTTVWRVRLSANNVNGAGYDPAISGTISTTLNGAITSSSTTIVVTSAAGWPASGNYYAMIGTTGADPIGQASEIVLVTGGQGTTSWTVTRSQLGTTAPANTPSGTTVNNDLTRGTTAAFTSNATPAGTSTASTTFTDATGSPFNETVVGNTLWLASGSGTTVGMYQITGFTNSSTITLDRASGTYTAGVWKIGGAWADPYARFDTGSPVLPGNTIYIRGAGTDAPSTDDYPKSGGSFITPPTGNTTNGHIFLIGENGRPRMSSNGLLFFNASLMTFQNVYISTTGAGNATVGIIGGGTDVHLKNCIMDQNGQAMTVFASNGGLVMDSEFKGSGTVSANGVGISAGNYNMLIIGNYIHGMRGVAVTSGSMMSLQNNVIAGNASDGVNLTNATNGYGYSIIGNTIDANLGDGISVTVASTMTSVKIANNIITNHSQASKAGIRVAGLTTAQNDRQTALLDYNNVWTNTSNYVGISAGAHDVSLDPGFANTGTGNYAVGAAMKAIGFPAAFRNLSTTSYVDLGAAQRQEPAASAPCIFGENVVPLYRAKWVPKTRRDARAANDNRPVIAACLGR